MASFQDLPIDILDPIIGSLSRRKDWHACALVNQDFNRIATPLLYRRLDSRFSKEYQVLVHPWSTLIKRPELAKYVRHVTESDSKFNEAEPSLHKQALDGLSLCTCIQSFTWTGESIQTSVLYSFLAVLKALPRPPVELSIRSHYDIGAKNWNLLSSFTGLERFSWFCVDGPAKVLQGWSETLGPTLTHLELGRCGGVPLTILISVFMDLPKLESLLLRGAPAPAVTSIVALLPNLKHLDTEYLPSFTSRRANQPNWTDESRRPKLKHFMIRISSFDFQDYVPIWSWINENVSHSEASLEVLKLHSYALPTNFTQVDIPRTFLLDLAKTHRATLKQFAVTGAHLTFADIECLCGIFPLLEIIECSVWNEEGDIEPLKDAIAKGKNLRALKFGRPPFNVGNVKHIMLRSKGSKIRSISMDGFLYTGKWCVLGEEVDPGDFQGMPEYQVAQNSKGEKKVLKFIVTRSDSSEESDSV